MAVTRFARGAPARFSDQTAGRKVVGIIGEERRRVELGEKQPFGLDVILVRTMEVGVLARHDRREQPAIEAQAVDSAEAERMARDLEDHRRRPGIRQATQRAMELDRRRRRQPFARIVEALVAGAERPQHPGLLAAASRSRRRMSLVLVLPNVPVKPMSESGVLVVLVVLK